MHEENRISENRLLDVMARYITHGVMAYHYEGARPWWFDVPVGTRVRMTRVAIRELYEHHKILLKSAQRRDKITLLITAPSVLDLLCAVLK